MFSWTTQAHHVVVSQKPRDPKIDQNKYNTYYGDSKKGAPKFGKHPYPKTLQGLGLAVDFLGDMRCAITPPPKTLHPYNDTYTHSPTLNPKRLNPSKGTCIDSPISPLSTSSLCQGRQRQCRMRQQSRPTMRSDGGGGGEVQKLHCGC